MMHPMALATSNRFLGHTDAMLGHADILLDEEMEEEEEPGLFVLNFLSKKNMSKSITVVIQILAF